jgi:hypothetical protein
MPVAQTSATTLEQNHLLTVISNVTQIFACFGIVCHRSAWNLYDNIIAVLAKALVAAAVAAVAGKSMAFITQVKQRPVVAVTLKDNATTLAAVTTIRAAIGDILVMTQMRRTPAPFAGTTKYLYVIYKIGFCHI